MSRPIQKPPNEKIWRTAPCVTPCAAARPRTRMMPTSTRFMAVRLGARDRPRGDDHRSPRWFRRKRSTSAASSSPDGMSFMSSASACRSSSSTVAAMSGSERTASATRDSCERERFFEVRQVDRDVEQRAQPLQDRERCARRRAPLEVVRHPAPERDAVEVARGGTRPRGPRGSPSVLRSAVSRCRTGSRAPASSPSR